MKKEPLRVPAHWTDAQLDEFYLTLMSNRNFLEEIVFSYYEKLIRRTCKEKKTVKFSQDLDGLERICVIARGHEKTQSNEKVQLN